MLFPMSWNHMPFAVGQFWRMTLYRYANCARVVFFRREEMCHFI